MISHEYAHLHDTQDAVRLTKLVETAAGHSVIATTYHLDGHTQCGILSALTPSRRPPRPFVHWRRLLQQSDDASSHLCGCTRHSNPTPPRLPPASSTILWTSDDDMRYYHALDGGFASKRYAYSHLLALYGYWDDLWKTPHAHLDTDLEAALWAGGSVDAELIHVCPGVPDTFRRARRQHHLVAAGATRTALRRSCTGAVGEIFCQLTMSPNPALEILKKGLSALKNQVKNRRDMLLERLKKEEKISAMDEA
ncbi:hypothetical protein B0H14DRAFT_3451387 [Mycena olivaceomarginata]|nr:hypothetical protein B0H14DRAFT_3451387 [Mycena olivaceomarginata]